MSNEQRTRVGTNYQSKDDGSLLYQCQYCQTWFEPKIRFRQKYCSQSCRVMASRERTEGLGGTLPKKRDATSNRDLLKQLTAIQAESKQNVDRAVQGFADHMHRKDLTTAKQLSNMEQQIRNVSDKLTWVMLIASVAPVMSPAIADWFRKVATGEKPKQDQILDKLGELAARLPQDTKEQLSGALDAAGYKEVAEVLLGLDPEPKVPEKAAKRPVRKKKKTPPRASGENG